MKPEEIKSIQQLEDEVKKVLLLQDTGVVKITAASVIANRMPLDPVWLMLIAPPSGGKTELIQALASLDFVFPISDITVNTFMSGQKRTGQETSLLLKMGNGVMTFKDFTSILSKNKDAKHEIMKQLREIFDGDYTKRTGTGEDIHWRGKVGAIAGATEVIYRQMEEFSIMGDRFVFYCIEQPDRLEVAARVFANAPDIQEKREHLKQCFKAYINYVIEKINSGDDEIELTAETKSDLLKIADFSTKARSAVMTDFKTGLVDFVPAVEMPMRVGSQLYTLAASFVAMHRATPGLGVTPAARGNITDDEKKILYKIALDSIPKMRRAVLRQLAIFKLGVSTAGLAASLNLPTPSVHKYLSQINALGLCKRVKKAGNQGDEWHLVEEYRTIMQQFEGVQTQEAALMASENDEMEEAWDAIDAIKKEEEMASLDMPLL